MELLETLVVNWFSWVYTVVTKLPDFNDPDMANSLMALLAWGAILAAIGLALSCICELKWGRKKDEPESREVAPGVRAWDIDRNSWWFRFYHFWLKKYPCDICSYVKHSVALLVATIFVGVGSLNFGFALGTFFICVVYWVIYGIVWFIINLPYILSGAAVSLYEIIMFIPSGVSDLSRSVSRSISNQWIVWAILTVVVFLIIYRLTKSRPYQVIKLRIESFREKNCIPIRVK